MSLHPVTPSLTALYRYPVKSTAAERLESAQVEPRGLAGDRRWMVVDGNGRFLTGRQFPRMVLLQAALRADGGLQLDHPDLGRATVARPPADAPRRSVQVWDATVEAQRADPAAGAWLAPLFGQPCELVYMDPQARRPVDPKYARPGDEVSFADGFPLLLISQAALDQLNGRASHPVSMLRFRPNLVVDGVAAHAEDGWRRIRIGALQFELAKPCVRCVFTTVLPDAGALDSGGEPLATLKAYRRSPKGITFGQNLIARSSGTLRCGDPVEVLETL